MVGKRTSIVAYETCDNARCRLSKRSNRRAKDLVHAALPRQELRSQTAGVVGFLGNFFQDLQEDLIDIDTLGERFEI